ncbi:hypothetical protein BH10ACI3_BH10ACI3_21230 [soil metagenome]
MEPILSALLAGVGPRSNVQGQKAKPKAKKPKTKLSKIPSQELLLCQKAGKWTFPDETISYLVDEKQQYFIYATDI